MPMPARGLGGGCQLDRITRKELKADRFAEEVEHTFEFVTGHRKQFIRYGAAAAGVAVLAAGWYFYSASQKRARQEALREATATYEAPVGGSGNPYLKSFATQAEKDKAVEKAFNDLVRKYSGSDEAHIALYYLAAKAADEGKMAEAEKRFKEVADSASRPYASLARYSLAQIYHAQGKTAEAEALLRDLIANPTALVSKEQATLTLGQMLADSKPAEARKLLEPLRTERGPVSRAALTALSGIR